MPSAVLDRSHSILSVNDHPIVQTHRRQREELTRALLTARADHARLNAERDRILNAVKEVQIARLLGEAHSTPDTTARRAQIEAELAPVSERIGLLEQALSRHDAIAKRARAQAQADIREQVRERARDVVRQMLPVVQQLEALNTELSKLHGLGAGGMRLPTPYRSAILSTAAWLAAARAFAGEPAS